MQKIDILVPEATTNIVKNPSFEKDLDNWVPEWTQEATFEDNELTPNPTGFDSLAGTDPTTLDVTGEAAIRGNFGFSVGIPDNSNRYGILSGPDGETKITVEFMLDINSIVMANGNQFALLDGVSPGAASLAFRILLIKTGPDNILVLQAVDDAGVPVSAATPVIADDSILVRVEFLASSGPGNDDGTVELFIEGFSEGSVTGFDNDTHNVTSIRIGAIAGVDAGTIGTIFLDNVRWAKGFVPFTGSSIEKSLERARFGRTSMKVITDGNALNEGVYYRADGSGVQSQVTGSLYIRGQGKFRLRMIDAFSSNTYVSKPVAINDERWHRLEVTGRAGGSDDLRLYIETAEAIQSVTFYIDGAQIEEKDVATIYCDGEQEGCRWNGVANLSTSTREATEMMGGRWISIRDSECDPDTYLTVIGGFGLPPVTINRQSTAQADGAVFDSVKSEERVIQMLIWVKDEGAQKQKGLGLERIKELRQILIDLVKPDVSPDSDPFILRVTENEREFTIPCRYEAGLEFDTDVRDKWRNSIPLRLLCLDPFWTEDGQEVALLDTETTFVNDSVVFSRTNGQWGIPPLDGFGANQAALAIEVDANGRIYFGGTFFTDGDGNVLRRFASFNDDFTQMIERGTGVNAQINAIASHPNGLIYIGGLFTTDNNGNAMLRIAEYDPDTDILSAMGAGANQLINGISVAPNGNVYVCGNFTTIGGFAANFVAFWQDGIWRTVGDMAVDVSPTKINNILALADDDVYIVGGTGSGASLFHWDGDDWTNLHESGDGNGHYNAVVQDLDGTILFGGARTSGRATGELMRWNGSAATQLGEDFETNLAEAGHGSIYAIAVGQDGLVYVVGDFSLGGSGLTYPFPGAIWNGSTFVYFDAEVLLDSGSNVWGLLVLPNNDIYLGGNDVPGNAIFAGSGITIVQNTSTRDVFPIVTITGTGKIIWLENQITGQRVYLDYILQEDEELTIDFTEGLEVTSNYRGSVPDAVLPNSDDFFLAAGNLNEPKDNIIAVFMVDEVDPVVQLRYTPTHWSIDAAAS